MHNKNAYLTTPDTEIACWWAGAKFEVTGLFGQEEQWGQKI